MDLEDYLPELTSDHTRNVRKTLARISRGYSALYNDDFPVSGMVIGCNWFYTFSMKPFDEIEEVAQLNNPSDWPTYKIHLIRGVLTDRFVPLERPLNDFRYDFPHREIALVPIVGVRKLEAENLTTKVFPMSDWYEVHHKDTLIKVFTKVPFGRENMVLTYQRTIS